MAKLLIVDDEQDVREFAASFFRKRNIDVQTACGGDDALSKIDIEHPQLVLLDIKMDGKDGIETLQCIKAKNKDIQVIMVTGKKPDEEEIYQKCIALGASDYIHKPLVMEELERIVLSFLKKE
ncbi:MAG: response regulator [Candidatus Omnitrophota bacterium]|jgi:DNA-binding response OmpR family regulator